MPRPPPPPKSEPFRLSCATCGLRDTCLPAGLEPSEVQQLEQLIAARRLIPRGGTLHRAGDRFERIAIVRTGHFKTGVASRDGREQVTGFQMAGEVLGFDGIFGGVHTCDAVALEDSHVCLVPLGGLERLARESVALQHQLHRLLSREIVRGQGALLLLGGMRAEERVAAFLLNLTRRMKARGFSSSRLVLRMTREEIGSFLGLTLETISRTLSRFHEAGVIEVKQREVCLLKPRQLFRLVDRSMR